MKDYEMSLDPFLFAPVHIQFHIIAAIMSVAIGPIALYRKRRDRVHKIVGYTWVVAMVSVAVSAFFIHTFALIGPFSPIHGLAVVTLWSLWAGVKHARAGRITAHRRTFRSLYWFGLMIAGLANFLPGRMANEALFGGNDDLGWIVIGVGAAALIAIARAGRSTARQKLAALRG
ncbi:DUF2306 domain-containing protein [Octadecabacter antarcticus]|nr:DUF2306 domain-containing protein [Octadecabacter antarcticus]